MLKNNFNDFFCFFIYVMVFKNFVRKVKNKLIICLNDILKFCLR